MSLSVSPSHIRLQLTVSPSPHRPIPLPYNPTVHKPHLQNLFILHSDHSPLIVLLSPLPTKIRRGVSSTPSLSMGCCCNEEDDDIFKTLMDTTTATKPLAGTLDSSGESPGSAAAEAGSRPPSDHLAVISPMNSNFSALICRDILRAIFERLAAHDLARSACVCRIWNAVASDREILIRAFKAPWRLRDVIGNPSSTSFWRDNGLGRFAISHKLVRGDSVASLAVKYSVQVMDIKRLNNMMSDHGIYSRERLLIPVRKPELLINGTCYIELDPYAKREVAVLYLEGAPVPVAGMSSLSGREATNRGKRRVIDSMRRSMQVDESTAEYYWQVSNGDARAAFSEFSEDLRWEQQANSL